MNEYEEKKQNRIERYKELAQKNKEKSNEAYKQSHDMVSGIPMGQPILIGHHSEKRHRNLLDKSWAKMGKSIELSDKANYYEGKAGAAENNTAISSDDPEALTKLKEKLKGMQESQELMKSANKIVKSKKLSEVEKVEKLQELGCTEKQAIGILTPDFCNRIGFPSYKLTNNNGNMKRVKDRIKSLEIRATQETTEIEINGVRLVDNVEANRIQIFFPDKPNEEVRAYLKRVCRFKWSGYNGCWQRHRSRDAQYYAKEVINKFYNLTE